MLRKLIQIIKDHIWLRRLERQLRDELGGTPLYRYFEDDSAETNYRTKLTHEN